jgi:hypothetical protein
MKGKTIVCAAAAALCAFGSTASAETRTTWIPDNGNGTFTLIKSLT